MKRTPEEKEEAERRRMTSRDNWDESYRADVLGRISETRRNKTEEEKKKQLEKFRDTINNKSDEEKELTRKRRSKATINHFKNMSEDERKDFSESVSRAYHRLTDEQKKNRVIKGIQTKKERYGDDYNSRQYEQSKERIVETNMQRYGVPYFCMTDVCMNSIGNKGSHSKENDSFQRLMESAGISDIEKEFVIGNYRYDFKVADDILIEINPTITHNSTYAPYNNEKPKDYHFLKTQEAIKNGYRCICVWDWDNKDAVVNLLCSTKSVGGRECRIADVSYKESVEFIDKHHIQGYAKSKINIGLYIGDELVSIMTFGKPRYSKSFDYELIRYCSSVKVIGGAKKLFKYFIDTYKPSSIVSYCDLSKFSGKTYIELGFEQSNISIGKHWYNIKTKKHITDNLLRQHGFDRLLGEEYGCYGKGSSNEELMLSNGFVEIYDCGQAKYVWKQR